MFVMLDLDAINLLMVSTTKSYADGPSMKAESLLKRTTLNFMYYSYSQNGMHAIRVCETSYASSDSVRILLQICSIPS